MVEETSGIHPALVEFSDAELATDPILQFFHYAHLPPKLQNASAPFCALASHIIHTLPRNAERTVALRKLLEAKDAAVRANLPAAPTFGQKELSLASEDVEHKTTARQLDEDEDLQVTETGGHDHVRDGDPPFGG